MKTDVKRYSRMTTNILEKVLETNKTQFVDELMSARTRHMVSELNDTVCEYPDNHFRLVLDAVGLSYEDAISISRAQSIVLKRFACYKYLRRMGYQTTHIGRLFCHDHATVIYGVNKFNELLETCYTPVIELNDRVEHLYNTTKYDKV